MGGRVERWLGGREVGGGGGRGGWLGRWVGVGMWVKIVSSNDIMCHAHCHPASHNIRNTFDGEACANIKEPQRETPSNIFYYSGGGSWERAFRRRHLR